MASLDKSSSALNDAAALNKEDTDLRQVEGLKPLPELLTNEIVALYVGPERKAFHVHKALICNRSSYFRAVFRDDVQFREGAANEVSFPDDNPAAFRQFMRWLYGGKISAVKFSTDPSLHVLLFALGEKLCLEKLKNDTMDMIKRSYHSDEAIMSREFVSQAYRSTPPGSPLRRFCVDMLGFTLGSGKVEFDLLQSFADAVGRGF